MWVLRKVPLLGIKVALRKESVDRNGFCDLEPIRNAESLSARRAWIEIFKLFKRRFVGQVALRKESVDRNSCL